MLLKLINCEYVSTYLLFSKKTNEIFKQLPTTVLYLHGSDEVAFWFGGIMRLIAYGDGYKINN